VIPMTFREWLIETKLHDDSALGDFAVDVLGDRHTVSLPNTREVWEAYLRRRRACVEAIEAFAEGWQAYEEYCVVHLVGPR
jgi:hypothetical protein